MPTDNFGERAATEEEIEDWVELVKAGRRATNRYNFTPERDREPIPRLDEDE